MWDSSGAATGRGRGAAFSKMAEIWVEFGWDVDLTLAEWQTRLFRFVLVLARLCWAEFLAQFLLNKHATSLVSVYQVPNLPKNRNSRICRNSGKLIGVSWNRLVKYKQTLRFDEVFLLDLEKHCQNEILIFSIQHSFPYETLTSLNFKLPNLYAHFCVCQLWKQQNGVGLKSIQILFEG